MKSFKEVFQHMNMNQELLTTFEGTQVHSLNLDSEQGILNVHILSDCILKDTGAHLKQFLKNQLDYLKEINVTISYKLKQSLSGPELIEAFWENILLFVQEKSQILYQMLKAATWEMEKNILTIHVDNANMFDSKELQQYIKARLDYEVAVVYTNFKEIEAKKQAYAKHIEKRERQLVQALSKEVSERPKTQKPAEPPKFQGGKNGNYRGGGGRRSKLQIVDGLEKKQLTPIKRINENTEVTVQGEIFHVDFTERGELVIGLFAIYDGTGAIHAKFFTNKDDAKGYQSVIGVGKSVYLSGKANYDEFSKEVLIMASAVGEKETIRREDLEPMKRIELHLHTQMSQMDGVASVKRLIDKAKSFGHEAVAITDHGVVQAYPDAAYSKGIKILYGMEAYVVDDQNAIVSLPRKQDFDAEYVVFDIETTGLSKDANQIIEIGAIKIKNGEIIDEFASLVDPKTKLSPKIIELTKITDSMLKGQPLEVEVIPKFLDFCGDAILVAHNASFDVGFIRSAAIRLMDRHISNTVIDTVELSRALLPNLKNHKLNTVAQHFEVGLENHHRAVDDATATAHIFLNCLQMLRDMGINTVEGINIYASQFIDTTKIKKHHHVTLLVKNQTGMRHLYELVSLSHINHFYRNQRNPKTSRPRIPKSALMRLREGLLVSTACIKGELYKGLLDDKTPEEIEQIADFYDYFEIQPHANYEHYVKHRSITKNMKELNQQIIELGKRHGKLVVATGDVHFLEPEDEIYRQVIQHGENIHNVRAPLYYRTTREMLDAFPYLDEATKKEVVIDNTHKISQMIEEVKPIPEGTFPPEIPGSEEELRRITMETVKATYGEQLHEVIQERLDRELNSIIGNGFAVMYMSAHLIIKRSLENKYTVGSRGSVGSSFVATMSGVTEVNPLQAHYLCGNCQHSEFDTPEIVSFLANTPGGSGCDLPDKNCPNCHTPMIKEGHDIPFETFLGFEGDKEPDIDLNFSGEYQSRAHDHASELFGEDKVFKAGTISTLADKTAYGYTRKFVEERNLGLNQAEINRIKLGMTGAKRTTGQHPGGLMIVPQTHSIYDFSPIQRPANDMRSTVTTTHFDYRSISGRLLKLDLLGHDVPTILKMLWDSTGLDPTTVPLSEPKVISLFNEPDALGITSAVVETGSLGIPEFGTGFVRNMLKDTKPQSFGELVRISGLSHGTDVWLNNAQELIQKGICTLKDVIATRDDIMVYLISKGLDKKLSFFITESVRKGKGLTPEWEEEMARNEVPDWYIESCKKIKYMFPKGHAVAYVMMAVRIAYYKLYYPESFYAAILSVKTSDFNYETMCSGNEMVEEELSRLKNQAEISATEKSTIVVLELVNEMYHRGYKFLPLDIYTADEQKFQVREDGIMPPLGSISGLGESVATNIMTERELGPFLTQENFKERTKASRSTVELLVRLGVLDGIPKTNQMTLF